WLIAAALLAIYIVLGMLYESYVHPLTVLSTLPSAGVGAVLALMLFKMEFSVIALIGVVLLIGIVKKNAILIIDFAIDAQRARGARGRARGRDVALQADPDDHARGRVRRAAARDRVRRGRGVPAAARDLDRRRAAREPAAHARHDAGDLRVRR